MVWSNWEGGFSNEPISKRNFVESCYSIHLFMLRINVYTKHLPPASIPPECMKSPCCYDLPTRYRSNQFSWVYSCIIHGTHRILSFYTFSKQAADWFLFHGNILIYVKQVMHVNLCRSNHPVVSSSSILWHTLRFQDKLIVSCLQQILMKKMSSS